MRARYNRGCPLRRFGDPGENVNPLGEASSASSRSRVARSGIGRGVITGIRRGRRTPAIVMVVRRGRGRGGVVTCTRGQGRGISPAVVVENVVTGVEVQVDMEVEELSFPDYEEHP